MFCALPLIYIILPETKDVPLEMIQNFFENQGNTFQIDLDSRDVELEAKPSEVKKNDEQSSVS